MSDDNPYAPPVMDRSITPSHAGITLRMTVTRFRQEIHALSASAIFQSLLAALLGYYSPWDSLLLVLCFYGVFVVLVSISYGIAVKKTRAVQFFLLFNWLMFLLSLVLAAATPPFGLFAATLFAFNASQCHRVLNWARTIHTAGLPLTVKSFEVPPISP